ncbi:hypothetical protein SYNPS1DRAFT_26543 [Syncephalis pseudoplumigaleata]|uniref:F-box domain-containing protein n=1 Tax=Syncephalis pseudoplumigaleata TaxID=1712513 RepID=A0A4P9Z5D0_9FUNG|nr:hypothetical protein SYNPS1DRAFT_26543 [Syncephalis pseudoplumigaleata]|eukprot:RKP27827.1 hypothetical protein SYNPS1DRAFT_26543 [Syncephalis pseudoplumigaleata]
MTTSTQPHSQERGPKIARLPYELLWAILLHIENSGIAALMQTSRYMRDICQRSASFWNRFYRERYGHDRIERDIKDWLDYAILPDYEDALDATIIAREKHAYHTYRMRTSIHDHWRTGAFLPLSVPVDRLKLEPLHRDDTWKMMAAAVWGGIWWSGLRGAVYVGLLKGSHHGGNVDAMQMHPLVLPSEAQLTYRFHPVFLTGRRHAVIVTPSNTSHSRIVAWSVDDRTLPARSWSLRDITSVPTVHGRWLACVSMELPETSIKIRLFPQERPAHDTARSALTLIDLDRTDERLYQFVDIGATAYHLHDIQQQKAVIFVHRLQEQGSQLSWQLGSIDIQSDPLSAAMPSTDHHPHQHDNNDAVAAPSWTQISRGSIRLASGISRYLFTSRRLDATRVLMQGSNLFGTKGCLALIDVSSRPSGHDHGDEAASFVWLNSHNYATVVSLVSRNLLVACPPRNDTVHTEENTAALILSLANGDILATIRGASWAQVEPIGGSFIAMRMKEISDASECFIIDIDTILPVDMGTRPRHHAFDELEVKQMSPSSSSSSTFSPSASAPSSSFAWHSLSRSASTMSDHLPWQEEQQPHGRPVVLKFHCYGCWHVSPTALMASFVVRKSATPDLTRPTLHRSHSSYICHSWATAETETASDTSCLYHFAYAL